MGIENERDWNRRRGPSKNRSATTVSSAGCNDAAREGTRPASLVRLEKCRLLNPE